jgi:spermidine synthase
MEAAGLFVRPYHTPVPSFGVWGFALARRAPFEPPAAAPPDARFLNADAMRSMFVLPTDLGPVPVEINRLDNQALVRYYEAEWRRFE